MVEWFKALVLKTSRLKDLVGSNPTSSLYVLYNCINMFLYVLEPKLCDLDVGKCYGSIFKFLQYISLDDNYYSYILYNKNLVDIYKDKFDIVSDLDDYLSQNNQRMDVISIAMSLLEFLKSNCSYTFYYVKSRKLYSNVLKTSDNVKILQLNQDSIFSVGIYYKGNIKMYQIYPNIIKIIKDKSKTLICNKIQIH